MSVFLRGAWPRLLSVGLILLFGRMSMAQAGGPAPVVTTTVTRETLATTAEFVASTRAWRRSWLAGEVAGLVLAVHVREGETIAEGALIAELSRELATEVLAAQRARVAYAKAELDEMLAGTREEEIARARFAWMESDRTAKRAAERLEQMTRQATDGAATQDQLLDAAMFLDVTRLRVNQLEAAFKLATAGPRPEQIAAARAKLATEEAEDRRLTAEDAKRAIRAPFSGTVASVHTEVGQWLERGGTVIELLDLSKIEVVAPIPQRYVGAVSVGSDVRISGESREDRTVIKATISRLAGHADEKGRTFPAYVVLDNADGRLRGGMSARVEIAVETPKVSLAVPKDCVYSAAGNDFVCAVVDGAIVQIPVRLGTRSAGFVAIDGQVHECMKVVIRGNERLFPGQPVREADRPPSRPAAGDGR